MNILDYQKAKETPLSYIKILERRLYKAQREIKHAKSLIDKCYYEQEIMITRQSIEAVRKIKEQSS